VKLCIFKSFSTAESAVSQHLMQAINHYHDLLRHKAANKIQWNTTKAQV